MHFDDGWVGGVFCHELDDVVSFVVVEAFEGGFVVYEDGGDLAVFDEWLLFDKYDVAIVDACADHGVAGGAEAEVCVDVGAGFDVAFEVFISKDGFPTGD